jgi:hypothetical protein
MGHASQWLQKDRYYAKGYAEYEVDGDYDEAATPRPIVYAWLLYQLLYLVQNQNDRYGLNLFFGSKFLQI